MEEPRGHARRLREVYELGREVGSGSFGRVWEVRDRETGVLYACKEIDKARVSEEADCSALEKEVRVLMMVRGRAPGVVQLREVLESSTHVHLMMEYCAGGDLFDLIATHGALPEPAAHYVFRQLASALCYLHWHGIAHRDIKPENILLSNPAHALYRCTSWAHQPPPLHAKLADFGLAALLTPGAKTQGSVGSKRYVAPEVVQGRAYGRRVDVWSLGVVLCAMLTGRLPFTGGCAIVEDREEEDDEELRQAILAAEVDFELSCWGGVSQGARDLVRRMLHPVPAKRLTATDVLKHPWVVGASVTCPTKGHLHAPPRARVVSA